MISKEMKFISALICGIGCGMLAGCLYDTVMGNAVNAKLVIAGMLAIVVSIFFQNIGQTVDRS
ncbi:MAG: hypothetical protein RL490_565 [Pseudomonadota bacterium]|jgi:hypothetical protein